MSQLSSVPLAFKLKKMPMSPWTSLMHSDHAGNAANTANGIQIYNTRLSEMRKKLLLERFWDNYQLSWGFWYHVYNNDVQSHEEMLCGPPLGP